MSYLKSLPHNAVLLDLFKAYPATSQPLIEYHQALLRGQSPLSIGQRELIAAFVDSVGSQGNIRTHTMRAFSADETSKIVEKIG